jgi:hypothetical protein
MCAMGTSIKREKGAKGGFEIVMSVNFPQINGREQTTDPGISENKKHNKCPSLPPTLHLMHTIYKLCKVK